ncbi:hypothetical protein EDD86DRAFT_237561 [Gorgonomyces haynaldii]|nr:hypothetical protein EDD86DRAFT_237561 [Gorgonomyces haynaldii]
MPSFLTVDSSLVILDVTSVCCSSIAASARCFPVPIVRFCLVGLCSPSEHFPATLAAPVAVPVSCCRFLVVSESPL